MRISHSIALAAMVFVSACERGTETEAPVAKPASPGGVASPASLGVPGESVVGEYNRRVQDYMALHKRLDSTMKWPDRATPQQIDANQRALGALIAKARSDAKVGDVFPAEMQTFIRGLVRRVLDAPGGGTPRSSIMDENPPGTKIQVNGRYPDNIPMSTMPPDILAALPALPEDLEYRFVGDRLILLDTKAHIIVDFVDNAMSK